MNYDETVKHLQTLLEIPLNQEDENFARITPLMFAYAENRIYRELDFLVTTTMQTGSLVANVREIQLPATVLVVRQINVINEVHILGPEWELPPAPQRIVSTRNTLERISPEALDMFWPQALEVPEAGRTPVLMGLPRQYAIIGNSTIGPPQAFSYIVRFMPTPDQAYPVEFLGVVRPEPLSPANTETLLSVQYPELLCAACMVFASGYQRDFGAQADDPQKAMSWEGMYTILRGSAVLEAARLRGEAAGWSSLPPAPVAQPRAP